MFICVFYPDSKYNVLLPAFHLQFAYVYSHLFEIQHFLCCSPFLYSFLMCIAARAIESSRRVRVITNMRAFWIEILETCLKKECKRIPRSCTSFLIHVNVRLLSLHDQPINAFQLTHSLFEAYTSLRLYTCFACCIFILEHLICYLFFVSKDFFLDFIMYFQRTPVFEF